MYYKDKLNTFWQLQRIEIKLLEYATKRFCKVSVELMHNLKGFLRLQLKPRYIISTANLAIIEIPLS